MHGQRACTRMHARTHTPTHDACMQHVHSRTHARTVVPTHIRALIYAHACTRMPVHTHVHGCLCIHMRHGCVSTLAFRHTRTAARMEQVILHGCEYVVTEVGRQSSGFLGRQTSSLTRQKSFGRSAPLTMDREKYAHMHAHTHTRTHAHTYMRTRARSQGRTDAPTDARTHACW